MLSLSHTISRLRDVTRFVSKTSYRLLNSLWPFLISHKYLLDALYNLFIFNSCHTLPSGQKSHQNLIRAKSQASLTVMLWLSPPVYNSEDLESFGKKCLRSLSFHIVTTPAYTISLPTNFLLWYFSCDTNTMKFTSCRNYCLIFIRHFSRHIVLLNLLFPRWEKKDISSELGIRK